MIATELLTDHFDATQAQLARKGYDLTPDVADAYLDRRRTQRDIEDLRATRNTYTSEIQQLMRSGQTDEAHAIIARSRDIGGQLSPLEESLRTATSRFDALHLSIPNVPADRTPDGKSEEDNQVQSYWGNKPLFDFDPQDHVDIGQGLGILDFATGAKLAGARNNIRRGKGALLERALINFMIDKAVSSGYELVTVPYMVNAATMQGTGQLPKFEDDLFKVSGQDERDLYLIPTSEVPLTNLYAGETVAADELPLKLTAYSECFRREAGSAGRDTRGMIRTHQFSKVELVQVTPPEDSWDALEFMTTHAEGVIQDLDLHYRKVTLCSGDLGFSAAYTTDLELWLPGQDRYREVSSVSNMTDFQSRRMGLRMTTKDGTKVYPHTLNGSALAIGRTLVAIMEQNQRADGSFVVPDVLQDRLGFDVVD